jgi:LPXTG-site transpeptidase (sortase) family protein
MRVLRTSVLQSRRIVNNRYALVLKSGSWRKQASPDKPEQPPSKRQIISNALIVAGGALCLYVAGTYTWMYARQKLLLRQFDAHNPAVSQTLTKLSIPRIKLEDVVLEGVSDRSLMLGPAHLAASVEPGSPGNAVIAGHRDSFFRRIHKLRYGDSIFVTRGERKFRYLVRSKRVVQPTDLSVIQPSSESELTLITCYPTHAVGPAPQRLIIVAKMAPAAPQPTVQAGAQPPAVGGKTPAPVE